MKRATIFAALFATFCLEAHSETIKIGHMPVINQVDIIAEQKGFYKANGLDVELKLFQTGPAAIQGLLSGDLHAVEAGGNPMLNLAAQNVPVYFLVSGGINSPKHLAGSIMVRTDDTSIKSFTDLKGKKLGTLPKGTITHLWISNAVTHYGMKREDIQEVFVPFPQMGGLLASKQVDAIYAWPPFDTMIAQAGQGRILVDDAVWNPYAVINAMIVRKDWADKNPDVVRKLVKATIEASRWTNANQEEARAIIGKKLSLPENVYRQMRMFHFPNNGYQLMPSIWDFYHLMISSGQLQPLPDPQATFQKYWYEPAQKFIEPVLKEIGRVDDPTVTEVLKIKLPNLPGSVSEYLAPWER